MSTETCLTQSLDIFSNPSSSSTTSSLSWMSLPGPVTKTASSGSGASTSSTASVSPQNQSCNGSKTEIAPVDRIQRIADFLKERINIAPEYGIICGSGLSNLAEMITERQTIRYSEIPEFPQSTVAGHAGELVFGYIENAPVICMRGRFHTYEGYEIQTTTLPIRVMALLGVKILMITNAAGSLNPNYRVGDLMFISDHINIPGISGKHPLVGPNDGRFGQRFIPLTNGYDLRLRNLAYRSAKKLGIESKIHTNGIYCFVSGPSYETPAEANGLRFMGGDAVGMSTVPEVIVAVHSGMKVFAMSLVTNKVILPKDLPRLQHSEREAVCHEEVLEASRKSMKDIEALMLQILKDLTNRQNDDDYMKDRGRYILRRKESTDSAPPDFDGEMRNSVRSQLSKVKQLAVVPPRHVVFPVSVGIGIGVAVGYFWLRR